MASQNATSTAVPQTSTRARVLSSFVMTNPPPTPPSPDSAPALPPSPPSKSQSSSAAPPPPPPKVFSQRPRNSSTYTGRKWKVNVAEDDHFDLANLKPVSKKQFHDPSHWDSIEQVMKADGGSVGVLFMKSKDDRVIVVKAHANMVQEIFATRIAQALGVRVPNLRVVGYRDSPEWKDIKRAIERVRKSHEVGTYLVRALNRAMTTIMEFAPGQPLDAFLANKERISNATAGAAGAPDRSVCFSTQQLKDLGAIIALDILVNNQDRIPSGYWSALNEGNAGNCILSSQHSTHSGDCEVSPTFTGTCTGIDSNVVTIDPAKDPAKVKVKISRIHGIILNLLDGDRGGICLKPLIAFFEQQAMHTLADDSLEIIRRSALETFSKICDVITPDFLNSLKVEVSEMIKIDWENVWMDMCSLIHVDFITAVVEDGIAPFRDQMDAFVKLHQR